MIDNIESWIVGFCEGEGCFGLIKGRSPVFAIGNCDESSMEIVKHFFDSLGVSYKYYTYDGAKPNWNRHYHISVHRKKDILILYEFFRNRLLTNNKKRDLAKWDKFLTNSDSHNISQKL